MFDENELQNLKDEYFQLVEGLCPEHAANIVNFYLAKRLRRIEFALAVSSIIAAMEKSEAQKS